MKYNFLYEIFPILQHGFIVIQHYIFTSDYKKISTKFTESRDDRPNNYYPTSIAFLCDEHYLCNHLDHIILTMINRCREAVVVFHRLCFILSCFCTFISLCHPYFMLIFSGNILSLTSAHFLFHNC